MGTTTTAQQQTVADQPTGWSQNLPFAQFNPSQGTLDGIGVSLSGDVVGTVSIESLEAAPSNLSVSLDGVVNVTSPTDVLMAQVTPDGFASGSLAADASTIFSGISAAATAQALFQPGTVDLGNFVGTGTVPLTVAATSQLEVTGPANMEVASQASAGATVVLQFDFSAPGGGSNNDLYGSVTDSFAPGLDFFPEPVTSTTTTPQTFSFADQTTGWTNSVPVLPFDPSLGTLEAVNITLTGNEAASVAAENEDATASTVSATETATLALDLPDGDTAVSAAPTISAGMSLGGYDGMADFAGTSGQIDQGLTQTATATATLTDPTDLALFSGASTVTLPLSAIGTATLDGPGNLLARLLAQAGASVSVSYTYVPWPQVTWTNPAGGDWGTGANWSSSPTAPTAGDAVEITQAGTYTITLAQAQTAESVVLDAPGAVVVLDAPLTLAAGFTLEAGTLEFNGGSLSVGSYEQDGGLAAGGTVDIVASGAIDLNAGTIDGTTSTLTAGTSINVSGAAVIATGTVGLTAGSISTSGSNAPIGSVVIENVVNPITPADVSPAQPITWTNAAGGTWSVGTNWSSSPNSPGPTDYAEIELAGSYAVTVTGTQAVTSLLLDDPSGTLAVLGTLNAGTLTLDAGTLDLGMPGTAGVLLDTTVQADGGTVAFADATLDGVTWQGPIYLNGTEDSLTILDGITLLPLSGPGPGTIDLTGDGSTLSFDTETLANALVNLGALDGSVGFDGPVQTGLVILPGGSFAPSPLLTLATTTTLAATTAGAGTILLADNIANQGVIDDARGNVALGAFTPAPGYYSGFPFYVYPSIRDTFDNQGTIIAAAGAGSNFTIGDRTTFSNEGLIQVANDDDLIVETGTFANTGTLSVAAGSTIEFAGTVSNIGTIAFAGTGGVLRLDNPNGVTGTLLNWSIGDEIALPTGDSYTLAINDGTLDVLQSGVLVAAFIVGPSESASDFPLSAARGSLAIGLPVVSWTNPNGGNWGSATDWSSDPTEPGATTNVAITLAGTYGVTVSDSRAINSVLLDDTGAALTVNGALSIGDTAAFDAGSVTVNGTLAAADADAIVANAVTLSTNLAFGTAAIEATLDNTGVVQVNHGTLSLNGGGSSNAFGLQAASNAVAEFGAPTGTVENTFSLTGGLYQGLDTVISGSTLDASAASGVIFGTLQLSASGVLLLGTNTAQTNAGFTQEPTGPGGASGTPLLSGTGTLTVFGGANLSGGEEAGTGLTRLYGLSVIGGSAGFLIDDGRTVENDGWLNWSSGNIALGNEFYPLYPLSPGGVLDNVSGATFYITASDDRIANGIGGTLDNAGVIAVYVGRSGVDIADPVYNTGYIQVQSGVLSLNNGGSSNASNLYVAPGAELEFGLADSSFGLPLNPGTFTLTGGDFTASTVLINGTTVNASASTVDLGMLRLAASGALLLGSGNAQTNGAFLQGPTTEVNAVGMPFLSGSGTFTVFGGASLTNGVESGSGTTLLFGVSSIGGAPAFELDGGRTVENDGWLNWSSGDITLGAGDASAATQSGTLTNVAGATFFVTASGDSINNVDGGVLNNAGVMAVYAGGGEVDIDAVVNNTGYIQVQSGTLSLNGGGSSDAGGMVVASGAVLQFGTAADGAGGTFTFTGDVYDVATTQITGGTVDLSAASGAVFGSSLAISGGSELRLGGLYTGTGTLGLGDDGSEGSLSDSGNFTVTSFAELGDGVLTGGGVVVLDGFSSIVGAVQVDGGSVLQNADALTWSSGSIALGSGDVGAASQAGYLNNVAGATFAIECDGSIASPGSGAVFNAGTIIKLGGSGTTSVQALLDNTGTVAVDSGTLSFAQAAIGAGTFDIGGSAVLDFASVVDSNATIAFIGGGGTLAIDSGGFGATVADFVSGDQIDLTAVEFALTPTLTFTQGVGSGTLMVSDGTHSVSFGMTGTFVQSSFQMLSEGHEGTSITY